MNKYLVFLALFITTYSFSQRSTLKGNAINMENKASNFTSSDTSNVKEVKPSIKLYKIYNLQKDSTYADTSLTLQSEYKYNLLKKDIFGLLPFLGASAVPMGSFAGAVAAIMLVMLLTGKRQDSIKLILLGVGISAFFNAVTTLVIYMAKNDSQMKSAIFWMLGSLAVTEWKNLILPAVLLLILLIVSSFISKELDILLLGDNTAAQLGLNIALVKLVLIIFSSLLIGVIVSICGIIGFVGLIIPHITRKLVGNKHKVLIPFSMLLGSIFLIWADNIARICFAPEELPIGIISSFLGAPFLILVVLRNYKFGDSNDGN